MFNEIPAVLKNRMLQLEKIDQQDRVDGTPRDKRLRQISYDTGQFLSLLVVNLPDGEIIEIGTSAGYSTIWLALAAKETNRKVKTFEIDEAKVKMARETFELVGLDNTIELIQGDFFDYEAKLGPVAFCFLDAEKDIYERCYQVVAPKMVSNGLLVADNATDQYFEIKPMIERALGDEQFDCLTVPIGNGEFICRKKMI
ncbi:O-methyltransferase [Pedobacter sp. L105]|uniref:O-methyltransferase n=1 Tax=Pedobacter sp. L105 TaxID=1641871 RepID=UPI00131B2EC0|nr:class I SAM-dependent methyltransferase [Pedobacter sp. L105]